MKRYAIQTWCDALGQHYRLFDRETVQTVSGLYSFSISGGGEAWAAGEVPIRVPGPSAVVELETARPIGWPGFESQEVQLKSVGELLVFVSRIDAEMIEYERIDPP